MDELSRFGISIEKALLLSYDNLIESKGYQNRSEAIRDLIRAALIEEKEEHDCDEMVGTVTLVYDHHTRDLSDNLTERQHRRQHLIISSMHVHLDHHNCLEVTVLKGKASEIRRLAAELIGLKGVLHGKLVITSLFTHSA